MGIDLVQIASARFAHLPGNQFKVLIRMCATALDKPNGKGQPARHYFAGWEVLSLALNRNVPPDEPANQRRRKRLRDEITTVCGDLCKAGAVQRLTDHPQTKQQQEYLLTLEPDATGTTDRGASSRADDATTGTTDPGATGTTDPGARRHHDSGATGTTNPGAQGLTEENSKDLYEDTTTTGSAQPQVRARVPRRTIHSPVENPRNTHPC